MNFIGDLVPGATVHLKFDTSGGFGLVTLGGSPSVAVYRDGSLTQITAGVVLTVDFDSVTGLHHVAIDTADAGNFPAGSSFDAVLEGSGTVDGLPVAGRLIGSFSLGRSAAYARLGAPVGASVSVDLAAIKAQTAAIETDTQDLQSRTPAALVGGRTDASVGAMAAGVLTATAIASDAITDAKVASDVTIASVTGAVGSVTGAVGSVTGAVGSVTGNVGGNVVGTIGSLGAQAKADVNAEADAALVDVGLTSTVTGRVDVAVSTRLATAGYTAPPAVGAIADQVWDEALSGHAVAGSAGAALSASTAPSAAAVADAVWDEATSGHVAAGSTGLALTSASAPSAATNAAAVWAYLTSAATTAGSMGAYLLAKLALLVPDRVTLVATVASEGEVITIYRGADHYAVDGREVSLTSSEWTNLTGAGAPTLTLFTLDTGRVVATITGSLVTTGPTGDQEVRFEPLAAVTALLLPGLPAYAWGAKCVLASGHVYPLLTGVANVRRVMA